MMRYSKVFFLFAGFAFVSAYSDRWFVFHCLDKEAVGVYFGILQVANTCMIAVSIVNHFSVPILFQKAGNAEQLDDIQEARHYLNKIFLFTLLFFSIVISIFYYWGAYIVVFFTNEVIAAHSSILWLLALNLFLFHSAQLYTLEGQILKKPEIYIFPKILQTFVLLGCSKYMIEISGIAGMCYSLLASSGVYWASVVFVNYRMKKRYYESFKIAD